MKTQPAQKRRLTILRISKIKFNQFSLPTDEATAPVRETEQDMETEGEGGNSPVTPNEDDLLTGASAADVETGIASLHVDSPAKPRGDDDAAT